MANGSFSSAVYSTSGLSLGTITVNWSSVANTTNNYSDVTVSVTVPTVTYAHNLRSKAYSLLCIDSASTYHGTTNYASASGGVYTLASRTYRVYHNSDGTKSGTISFYMAGFTFTSDDDEGTTTTHTVNAFSVYNTVTLDKITVVANNPSIPTVSTSTLEMGSSVTINTNRTNNTYTHTLKYSFNGHSDTIATNVGAEHPWTPKVETFAPMIPNVSSAICTISCETYNSSGTKIGDTKSCTITLTVPKTVKPTVHTSISQADSVVPSSWGIYVNGKSKIKISASATGTYGSSISTYYISGAGYSSNTNTLTTGVLYKTTSSESETINFTVKVTDSRGNLAEEIVPITLYAYNVPSVSNASVLRCNSSGAVSDEGTSALVQATAIYSSCNGKNACTLQATYGTSKTNCGDEEALVSGVAKTCWTDKILTDSNYVVKLIATDFFGNSTPLYLDLTSTGVLLSYYEDTGFTLGSTATGSGFVCHMDTDFKKDVKSELDVIAGYGTDDETSLLELKELIGTGGVTIDSALSDTSTNPVQNKVINAALNDKLSTSGGTVSTESFGALTIERAGSAYGAGMSFKNSNGVLGHIYMGGAPNGGLLRATADQQTTYSILDSSNYTSYCTPANIGAATSSHTHDGYATSDGIITGLLEESGNICVSTTSGDVILATEHSLPNGWFTKVLTYSSSLSSGSGEVVCYYHPTLKLAVVYINCVTFGEDSGLMVTNLPKPAYYIDFIISEDYTQSASGYIGTNGRLGLHDWHDLTNEFSAVITYNYVN